MSVENLILQSSKEGIDQYGTDYNILFARGQIVKSDLIHNVIDATFDLINFAKTCDPRWREILVNDAKTNKYRIASLSSVGGKTLQITQTTTQKHDIKQQNVKNRGMMESLMKGKEAPTE